MSESEPKSDEPWVINKETKTRSGASKNSEPPKTSKQSNSAETTAFNESGSAAETTKSTERDDPPFASELSVPVESGNSKLLIWSSFRIPLIGIAIFVVLGGLIVIIARWPNSAANDGTQGGANAQSTESTDQTSGQTSSPPIGDTKPEGATGKDSLKKAKRELPPGEPGGRRKTGSDGETPVQKSALLKIEPPTRPPSSIVEDP